MLRITLILASLTLSAAVSAETLVLNNGDRITGSIVSIEKGIITFNSPLIGTITVPEDAATLEAPAPEVTPESAAATANEIVAGTDVDETAEATDAQKEDVDAVTASLNDAEDWVQSVKPEGWTGKLTFGLSYLETDSETLAMNFGFNGKKDAAPNHYKFDMFYQYNKQTDQNGVEDKNLDKYGASVGYDYDFNDWIFFSSELSYLRDMVKDINHQADLDLGVGFHVIKEEHMTLNIIPAYTLQYKEAEGVSQKWYHLATLKENFHYDFSEIVRLEQSASASIAPADTSDYQYKVNVALISKLADWIDASISYQLSFDNTVGTGGTKQEQQVIFGLGVPY